MNKSSLSYLTLLIASLQEYHFTGAVRDRRLNNANSYALSLIGFFFTSRCFDDRFLVKERHGMVADFASEISYVHQKQKVSRHNFKQQTKTHQ